MSRITQQQAAAWGEPSKMATALAALDVPLLDQLESELLGRISSYGIDTSTWISDTTTPKLIQTIIAKKYVSWLVDRQYSTDVDLSAYAARLDANAELLMTGLASGQIDLPDTISTVSQPSFYPNDMSSGQTPTFSDPSLGGPAFSMGQTF